MNKIIISIIIAGLIAVFADIVIKQLIIQPLFEHNYMSEECMKYRKTKIHMFSVFLVGGILYLILYYIKLYKY
jgi:hypothetical protein